jgi:hypothetical protein
MRHQAEQNISELTKQVKDGLHEIERIQSNITHERNEIISSVTSMVNMENDDDDELTLGSIRGVFKPLLDKFNDNIINQQEILSITTKKNIDLQLAIKKIEAIDFLLDQEKLGRASGDEVVKLFEMLPKITGSSEEELNASNARLQRFLEENADELPDHVTEYVLEWLKVSK